MTKRITIIVLLLAFVCVEANAQNRRHRRRGVLLGGLAGAALGAAIGDKGDNETAGALIGGAVGAIAGGTIGNQKDQRIEHYRRYHSGHGHYTQPYGSRQYPTTPHYSQPYTYTVPTYRQPVTSPGVPPAAAPSRDLVQGVSPKEVVTMMQNGLSESTIIQQIRINGVSRALTVSDVIELHQQGVSEAILNQMQAAAPLNSDRELMNAPTPSYDIPLTPARSYGPSVLQSGSNP